jgi:hypothetical protein
LKAPVGGDLAGDVELDAAAANLAERDQEVGGCVGIGIVLEDVGLGDFVRGGGESETSVEEVAFEAGFEGRAFLGIERTAAVFVGETLGNETLGVGKIKRGVGTEFIDDAGARGERAVGAAHRAEVVFVDEVFVASGEEKVPALAPGDLILHVETGPEQIGVGGAVNAARKIVAGGAGEAVDRIVEIDVGHLGHWNGEAAEPGVGEIKFTADESLVREVAVLERAEKIGGGAVLFDAAILVAEFPAHRASIGEQAAGLVVLLKALIIEPSVGGVEAKIAGENVIEAGLDNIGFEGLEIRRLGGGERGVGEETSVFERHAAESVSGVVLIDVLGFDVQACGG